MHFSDVVDTGLMPDCTTRITCKGKPLYHYYGIGTASYSEYSVLPEIAVVKVSTLYIFRPGFFGLVRPGGGGPPPPLPQDLEGR